MKCPRVLLLSLAVVPAIIFSEEATPEKKSVEAKAAPAAEEGIGDFGSADPVPRADEPERGVLRFAVDANSFAAGQHWDQYNIPFKAARWGSYQVRITYSMTAGSLGAQFVFGKGTASEAMLKKLLTFTGGAKRQTTLGKIYIPASGDNFMALFTPQGAGSTFFLHEIVLVPACEGDEIKPADDGSFELLAKNATTWSENMRYEPKPEKNCLGFWTTQEDFAEWEIKVAKPGKYKVNVHQGSATGGSEIAVQMGEQKLSFTVKNTGDFHKIAEVSAGEVEIKEPGTYHLAVKPQKKNGGAIMDVQKIVLVPVG